MSDLIIRAENIGKRYTLNHQAGNGGYKRFSDTLIHAAKAPVRMFAKKRGEGAEQNTPEEFWALQNISFGIQRGEVVGIIGRNGAGKSTLLKVLSRITEPTTGRVSLKGRVASLLEVGTGFHPELSGRENIYLNGAILGMRTAEIKAKFDEIVAFAEIDKFLDTPVKHYSSGMYVRLAFAVAAHLEPEILIVDEVLAVGDAQFQAKCLGKMQDVAKGDGRTVLFVSHNMTAVQTLCRRAILLREGKILSDGAVETVVHGYLNAGGHVVLKQTWADEAAAPGTNLVRLKKAEILSAGLGTGGCLSITEPLELIFEGWSLQPLATLNLSVVLWTSARECAFNVISQAMPLSKGVFRGVCRIPAHLLNAESYSIDLYVVQDTSIILHIQKDVLSFEVVEGARTVNWYGKWLGAVRPQLDFSLGNHFDHD